MPVKDGGLLVTIRREILNALCSRETGRVKVNLTMLNRLGNVAGNELGLEK